MIIVFFFCVNTCTAQSAKKIINDYYSVISKNGSIKDWESIYALYMTSKGFFYKKNEKSFFKNRQYFTNDQYLKSPKEEIRSDTVTTKLFRIWPYSQRSELYKKDMPYVTFYMSKSETIMKYPNGPEIKIEDPIYFNFYSLLLKNKLKESKLVRAVEKEKKDGNIYNKICVKKGEKSAYYYFDMQTKLLTYIFENNVWTQLKDYQKINDFYIPMEISKYANKEKFYESSRLIIKIDPPINSLGL